MFLLFFFNATATTEIYTLSLHDALPIFRERMHTVDEGVAYLRFLFVDEVVPDEKAAKMLGPEHADLLREARSEEHTSELQSRRDLVCRLLLEKKKKTRRSSN